MDDQNTDSKEQKTIKQPVIRMDYCSDDCTSCGEICEYRIDPAKSFWGWLKSKFSRGSKDKT